MQKIVKITSSDGDPSDALSCYSDAGWRVVEIVRNFEADDSSSSFEWTVLLQNDDGDADIQELDEILQKAQKKNSIKNTIVTVTISALCVIAIIVLSLALKNFL